MLISSENECTKGKKGKLISTRIQDIPTRKRKSQWEKWEGTEERKKRKEQRQWKVVGWGDDAGEIRRQGESSGNLPLRDPKKGGEETERSLSQRPQKRTLK